MKSLLVTDTGRAEAVKKGQVGYDNPRENIDPRIVTKVVLGEQVNLNTSRTSGTGAILKSSWNGSVLSGSSLSLIEVTGSNNATTPGTGELYSIFLTTHTDATDTGAGIAIANNGKSDSIYLNVAGKGGGVNSEPTGIGMDLNPDDNNNTGYGMQIWDWSTTDRGTGGATALYLLKRKNPDSEHYLSRLQGNSNLMVFQVSGSATLPIVRVQDVASAHTKMAIDADGAIWTEQDIDALKYKVGGRDGFTGTGAYTNFTISGGIIIAAS